MSRLLDHSPAESPALRATAQARRTQLASLRSALALALLACACSAPGVPPPPSSPRPAAVQQAALVTLSSPSGRAATVRVELARSPAEQERGLMFRRHLGPDEGMLFLFAESSDHVFWMKDTPLSLDLVFIGEGGEVVGVVERAEPMTLSPRAVGRPSRAVLEVSAGFAAEHAVTIGDRVTYAGFRP